MAHMAESTSTPRSHLFRFSLRTLLIAVTVVAAVLGWKVNAVQNRRRTVAEIEKDKRCYVCYDYLDPATEPPGPQWMRRFLGDDFFSDVKEVTIFSDKLPTNGQHDIDALVHHIATLSNLKTLQIDSGNLTDGQLEIITRLSKLQDLEVTSTRISTGIAHACRLKHLTVLRLYESHTTDSDLSQLALVRQLEVLTLESNEITDSGLSHLAVLTNLKDLQLLSDKITNSGLPVIAALPKLRYLNLWNAQITDAGLAHLKRLAHLEIIELHNTGVTQAGADDLQKALPQCLVTCN